MFELNVQKLARNCSNFYKELDNLNLKYQEEGDYLHIDYNINSPRDNNIVRECRGLVLHKKTFEIVRFPFARFMNYGEIGQDKISNDSSIIVQEKVDGSLIIVHYLNGEWNIGTRGKLYANIPITNKKITFSELFKSIVDSSFFEKLDTSYQYFFELCSLYNRVVIPYNHSKVVLIGARNIHDWKECNQLWLDESAKLLNVERPKIYKFENLKEVLINAENIKTLDEGFVVVQETNDINFKRIKVKSEIYKEMHKTLFAKSLYSITRMVILKQKEIFKQFPEYLKSYEIIENKYISWLNEIENIYNECFNIVNSQYKIEHNKYFAQLVSKYPHSYLFFMRFRNKINNFQSELEKICINKIGIKKIVQWIEIDKIIDNSWTLIDEEI